MKIRIRTKETCKITAGGKRCGRPFNVGNAFTCPVHPHAHPVKGFLDITGLDGPHGPRQKLYSDRQARPLYFGPNGAANHGSIGMLKSEILDSLARGTFDIRSFMPKEKNKFLWRNYYEKDYLPALEKRTAHPHDSKDWLSMAAFDELLAYQERYLLPYFGAHELVEITRPIVDKFLLNLVGVDSGVIASDTIKAKSLAGIIHMINHAMRYEGLAYVAIDLPKIDRKRSARKIIRPLTFADQLTLLTAIEKRHQPLFIWLFLTGRHINEVRAQKIGEVDLVNMNYKVVGAFDVSKKGEFYKPHPKVKRAAHTSLPVQDEDPLRVELMVSALRSAMGARIGAGDWVFVNPNHRDGRPYTHRAVAGIFDKARKETGINTTLQDASRHSWATQKLNAGWDFHQIGLFLLDDAATVKNFYADVTPYTRAKVIEMHTKPKEVPKSAIL